MKKFIAIITLILTVAITLSAVADFTYEEGTTECLITMAQAVANVSEYGIEDFPNAQIELYVIWETSEEYLNELRSNTGTMSNESYHGTYKFDDGYCDISGYARYNMKGELEVVKAVYIFYTEITK